MHAHVKKIDVLIKKIEFLTSDDVQGGRLKFDLIGDKLPFELELVVRTRNFSGEAPNEVFIFFGL